MTYAYDKAYIEKAQVTLACMLDYAVNDLVFDITSFFDLFISSGVAALFETGDPNTIVGKSGVELALSVLDKSGVLYKASRAGIRYDRTKEYWTGWVIAYYQWYTSQTFAQIVRSVPIADVRDMYSPYHEMDIRQFCDRMEELIRSSNPETNLKRIRMQLGFSQSRLASESGVPLRTIQQYEQRQKNINNARAEYVMFLAEALHCNPGELMERG